MQAFESELAAALQQVFSVEEADDAQFRVLGEELAGRNVRNAEVRTVYEDLRKYQPVEPVPNV